MKENVLKMVRCIPPADEVVDAADEVVGNDVL